MAGLHSLISFVLYFFHLIYCWRSIRSAERFYTTVIHQLLVSDHHTGLCCCRGGSSIAALYEQHNMHICQSPNLITLLLQALAYSLNV
jgi:hypothetical protein